MYAIIRHVVLNIACLTQLALTVEDVGEMRLVFHLQTSFGWDTLEFQDKSKRW